MSINLKILTFAILYLFLTGCGIDPKTSDTATSEPPVITATLPATAPLHPSSTPLPPTPQPTLPPVEGITSTQLNVRAEPSTTSEVLGIITANSKVQITGRDIGDNWWQIIYETGADGKGWITAQYVDTEDNSQVPVIGGDDSNPNSGNTAIVIQQLNIRSGPGTDFDSLGILNENDVINLTGKNRNGTWLQFDFSNSPEGKGWVSSGFVKADDSIGLPIVSDEGDVIGTGTPVDTPLPPTPTIVPAPMDFDTAENPIKTVILGGVGTHTVLYNGDVSFPKGDTEDWILIIPQENALFVAVDCLGNNLIQIGIIGMQTNITCGGNIQSISVSVDVPLLIHIQAIGPADQLQYTRYILEIKVNP